MDGSGQTKPQLKMLGDMRLWHIRGQGAENAITALEINSQKDIFSYQTLSEGNSFLAKLGNTEFLLLANEASKMNARIQTTGVDETYIFPRDDTLFRLSGKGATNFLRYVCSFNFSSLRNHRFITASVVGVSVWFLVEDQQDMIFGCDPSYGHYLHATLQDVLNNHYLDTKSTNTSHSVPLRN